MQLVQIFKHSIFSSFNPQFNNCNLLKSLNIPTHFGIIGNRIYNKLSSAFTLNNLIEMKIAEGSNGIKVSLPLNIDKQIVELYQTFEKRVQNNEDVTAQKYKDAIINDEIAIALWSWGLIN